MKRSKLWFLFTFTLIILVLSITSNEITLYGSEALEPEYNCDDNADFHNRLRNNVNREVVFTICDGSEIIKSDMEISLENWDVDGVWAKCMETDNQCVYKLGRGRGDELGWRIWTAPHLPDGYFFISGVGDCIHQANDPLIEKLENRHCGWKEEGYFGWTSPSGNDQPNYRLLRRWVAHCDYWDGCVKQENDPLPHYTCEDLSYDGVILFDQSECQGESYLPFSQPIAAPTENFDAQSLYLHGGWSTLIVDATNNMFCASKSYTNFNQVKYPNTDTHIQDSIVSINIYQDSTCGDIDLDMDGQIDESAIPPSQASNDTIPPSALDFNVTVSGNIATLDVSNVIDNIEGSGINEVRYSAKWNDEWYGIGITSVYPYPFIWNICAENVPSGDVEFGMEVWDYAGNKWVWSEHYPNPHAENSCGGDEGWIFEFSKAERPPLEVDIHVVVDDTDLDAWRVCFDGANCQENAVPITELFYTWNTYGWSDGFHTLSIEYRRQSDGGNWDNALYYEEQYYLSPNRNSFAPCDGGEGITLTSNEDCIRIVEDVGDLMPVGWNNRSDVTACVTGDYTAWVYDGVQDQYGNFGGGAPPKVVVSGQCKAVGSNVSSVDLQSSAVAIDPLPDTPFETDEDTVVHLSNDGNTVDLANAINCSLAGSASYVTGKFGSAIYAPNPPDGSGVSCDALDIDTFTIELWIARPQGSNGGRIVSLLGGGSNNIGENKVLVSLDGNTPRAEIWSANGSQIVSSFKNIPDDGSYHYLVVTYDGENTAVMYLDNELVGTLTTAGVVSSGATTLEFGMGEGIYSCECYIDEVRISNVVRTPETAAVIETPTPVPTATSTSVPSTEYIIYISTQNGYEQLFKSDTDGSNPVAIAGDGSGSWKHASYPRICGNDVAYEAHNGSRYLWIMDSDGNNKNQLYSNPIHHAQTTWSPDCSKIMFIGTDNVARTIEPDGSNLTTISGWDANYKPSSWCSNGKIIAHNDSAQEIYSLNPDGSGAVNLTNTSGRDAHPDWSTDCSKITFSSNRSGKYEVYTMNADGSSQTKITNTPSTANSLYSNWSPDGTKISFATGWWPSGYWEIATMNADGSNVVNISNTSGSAAEQWNDWSNQPFVIVPTATSTVVPTNTPLPTETPTVVPTNTPVPTATDTPAPTVEPTIIGNPNLLANGDFETVTSGWFDSWVRSDSSYDMTTSSISGSYSVELTGSGDSYFFSEMVGVDSNKSYTWRTSLDILVLSSSGEFGFYISEYNTSGDWISGQWKGAYYDPFTGSKIVNYNPTSSNVASIELEYYWYWGTNISARIDDVEFLEIVETSDPNLLSNGDFEAVTLGWFDYWDRTDNNYTVTTNSISGTYSLHLTGSSDTYLFSEVFPVDPSTDYLWTSQLDATTMSDGEFGFYIDEYDADGWWISGQWKGAYYAPFTTQEVINYTPSSSNVAQIDLQYYWYGGTSIDIRIDDVSFETE